MIRLSMLALTGILTGCAAMGGGADYTYQHVDKNGASCSVTVGSTRSLSGVGIRITSNCELEASAEQADANKELVQAIGKLIDKIPAVPVRVQ